MRRLAYLCSFWLALAGPLAALAQSQYTSIPQNTVVKVRVLDQISSKTAQVGDQLRVRVAEGDSSGLPTGTVLVGRVTEVQRAAKNRPGVLDFNFVTAQWNGQTRPISGDLYALDSKSVEETASGRLVAKKKSSDKTKFIGYGALGGVLLGKILGTSSLQGALIGAAGGYIYGQTRKDKDQYRDVELKDGTEFGVRLNRRLAVPLTATAQSHQSRYNTISQNAVSQNSIPQNTVVKVRALDQISSKTAQVGDQFRVRVADDDASGLPTGTVLVGRVTEVQRASKDRPGVLDFNFVTAQWNGQTRPISGDLYALDSKSVEETASGRLVAKKKSSDKSKFIGYGALGGLVLGKVLGISSLKGALIGAAGGYLYGQSRKDKDQYRDVELKDSTEFGVRLNRRLVVDQT